MKITVNSSATTKQPAPDVYLDADGDLRFKDDCGGCWCWSKNLKLPWSSSEDMHEIEWRPPVTLDLTEGSITMDFSA